MDDRLNRASKVSCQDMSEALLQILESKPLEKISVTEVCKRSGYNRTTFYNNFTDINDLARLACTEVALNISHVYGDHLPITTQPDFFIPMLEEMKAHRNKYLACYKVLDLEDMAQSASDFFSGHNNSSFYSELYKTAGVGSVIKNWLMNSCPEDPDQLSQILIDLIN